MRFAKRVFFWSGLYGILFLASYLRTGTRAAQPLPAGPKH